MDKSLDEVCFIVSLSKRHPLNLFFVLVSRSLPPPAVLNTQGVGLRVVVTPLVLKYLGQLAHHPRPRLA
jgi:hypothetical protein